MEVMRGVPSNLLPAGPTEYSFLGVLGPLNEDRKQGDKKKSSNKKGLAKGDPGSWPTTQNP